MKLKKEYILLTLAVLALVFYLTLRSANHDETGLPQPAKIESAKINRLVVTDKTNPPLELVKKDEKWFIESKGYQADAVKVKNMINAAAELTVTALVSESGNYDRYDLTAQQKINVQVFGDGTRLRAFDIGKSAPTLQHTFVLLDGDPKIYHARGQLRTTFDQNIDALRDKTVFNIEKETITAITIQKEGKTFSAAKVDLPIEAAKETPPADGNATTEATSEKAASPTPAEPPQPQWQAADGQALDKAAIERLLGSLARLQCDSFLDDPAREKLTAAACTITLKTAQAEFTLTVFPKEGEKAEQIPALASTTPYAFMLNEFRFKENEKTINKLLGIEEVKK
jgi:hypothetical protein